MIEHKSLVNTIHATAKQLSVNCNSAFLHSLSINFDAASWVLWMTLTRGAKLVLTNAQEQLSEGVVDCINREQVTHLVMTPSSLLTLEQTNISSVQVVTVGGEACPEKLVDEWFPKVQFLNAYGPTETTICSSIYQVRDNHNTVSIGNPINNTFFYVMSKEMNLLPEGVCGELYIGGDGLARGYLNNDSLTAERFIANPFYDPNRAGSSKRIYKTGDLVRWLPDGNLAYLGRIDHQVKLRGFRIELGEIERCLATQEYVQEAVVLSKLSERGVTQLVAYVSIGKENGLRADDKTGRDWNTILGQYSRQYLPDYMIPSVFVVLESMPLTPNG
ncbi:amino acid adenylation domain-containing protein, partial [Rheinheimera gaetbuli]